MKIAERFAVKMFVAGCLTLTISVGTNDVFAQVTTQPKQYQTPPQSANEPLTSAPTVIVSPNEDYLIGKSDVLEIRVEDAPELSGVYRLNANGTFMLPVVGRVLAQDKRTDDISAAIADKLRGGYLINPIVTVLVRQSNSRAFFIQGAVRRPGIYQIEGHPSLLKLITVAGGLADNYGSTAFVMREKTTNENQANASTDSPNPNDANAADGDDKYDLRRANINNLLRGNLDQNIVIEPGDIVHIPQTDVFFVAGEVKSPGSFPLKDGTTLRQAISLAQGTKFEGNASRGVIFREDRSGKRQEIPINIAEVMAGKKDDVDILPNDIIIVPNSKTKSVTKAILQSASGGIPGLILRGGF